MTRPLSRRPTALLAGTLLALLFTSCVPVPIDEETLFRPKESVTLRTFEHPEAELEELFFASEDGTRINAWYLSRPEARATVLFFGGYGFYLVQSRPYIDMFLEQNVNVLMVDYRGYGRSEGQPAVAALKTDAHRAYEVLTAELETDPRRLIVHGHSLGTFMAAYVAEEREAAALVLENPATSAREWTRTAVPWYLRLILSFEIAESFEHEDNLARLREVEEHVLIFAGTEDRVTPAEMARELRDAARAAEGRRLVMIDGGSHPDLHEFPDYRSAYRELVSEVADRGE